LNFPLAKQVLYHLSHTPVHFSLVILEMESQKLLAWAGFELRSSLSASQVAEIWDWDLVLGSELRAYLLSHSTSPFLWWVFSR
jgi:hypothetical protein